MDSVGNTSLVLFGQETGLLPEELRERLGGMELREIPGFAPQWKPSKAGDFLLGQIRSVRHDVGKYHATVVTMQTAAGFRSVFLGADLKMKFLDGQDLRGRVFSLSYEGETKTAGDEKKAMRQYRVIEILAPTK